MTGFDACGTGSRTTAYDAHRRIGRLPLIDALRRGALAGAGLDVFDHEPRPEAHTRQGLRSTVLTPHPGDATEEWLRGRGRTQGVENERRNL